MIRDEQENGERRIFFLFCDPPFSLLLLISWSKCSVTVNATSIVRCLRNREPFEDPGRTCGQADAGIAGGHSKNQAEVGADGSVSQASPDAHGASAFRSDRRLAASGVETAVDFSDHLDPLFHRTGDREPVGEDVVLPIALDWIGGNAET